MKPESDGNKIGLAEQIALSVAWSHCAWDTGGSHSVTLIGDHGKQDIKLAVSVAKIGLICEL